METTSIPELKVVIILVIGETLVWWLNVRNDITDIFYIIKRKTFKSKQIVLNILKNEQFEIPHIF